jgi:hypothetical protein
MVPLNKTDQEESSTVWLKIVRPPGDLPIVLGRISAFVPNLAEQRRHPAPGWMGIIEIVGGRSPRQIEQQAL